MNDIEYYNEVDHIIKMLLKDTEYRCLKDYLIDIQKETIERYYNSIL